MESHAFSPDCSHLQSLHHARGKFNKLRRKMTRLNKQSENDELARWEKAAVDQLRQRTWKKLHRMHTLATRPAEAEPKKYYKPAYSSSRFVAQPNNGNGLCGGLNSASNPFSLPSHMLEVLGIDDPIDPELETLIGSLMLTIAQSALTVGTVPPLSDSQERAFAPWDTDEARDFRHDLPDFCP